MGSDKTINVDGISLSGTDAGNYTANTTAVTTADITPATLVVSATGSDKVFDGTTSATVLLSDNRLAGDVLTTSNADANFDSAAVGDDKSISVTGITATGTDAGNYTHNSTATTFASITEGTSPTPTPTPTPTPPIDDITLSVMTVTPVTPFSNNGFVPLALQTDAQSVSIAATPIVPLALLDLTPSSISVTESGSNAVPAIPTRFMGVQQANSTSMLSVLQAPQASQGPEMLFLYPLRQLTPYVAPVRLPRQRRN